MAATILFPQFFLPSESVKLGRFITSVDHPHQDFHDPPSADPPVATITLRYQYNSLSHESDKSGFSSALTSLISAGFTKRAQKKVRVSTECVRTYTLENSRRWFEAAAGLDDTRQWLESAFDQGDVYLIVGYHTITDARIAHQAAQGTEHAGQVGVPVSLTLAAVGVVAPFGNLVDAQVGAGRQEVGGVVEQFLAPGEQVCALQYRKVCPRFLSSNVEKATLSKAPRWTTFNRLRNETGGEGEDDIIEVEMQEVGQLEGEWDRETASDGEVLIIRS